MRLHQEIQFPINKKQCYTDADMSKITASFLALVFVIIFSSIIYIWQADAEKRELESQISDQQEQIANLKTQIQLQANQGTISNGDVRGVETQTGQLTGSVTIFNTQEYNTVIVCVKETRTLQETCLDFNIEKNTNQYDFEFDIPQGTYEVYAILPPLETKVYYSDIKTCDSNGDCTSNFKNKRLVKIEINQVQANIDISL
jgi:hypothetical protein